MKWVSVWERPGGGVRAMPEDEIMRMNRESFRLGLDHALAPIAVTETLESAMAVARDLKRERRMVMDARGAMPEKVNG